MFINFKTCTRKRTHQPKLHQITYHSAKILLCSNEKNFKKEISQENSLQRYFLIIVRRYFSTQKFKQPNNLLKSIFCANCKQPNTLLKLPCMQILFHQPNNLLDFLFTQKLQQPNNLLRFIFAHMLQQTNSPLKRTFSNSKKKC